MTLSDLTGALSTLLADFPSIGLVYLFGSRVTGAIGPLSDYDLAIYDVTNQADIELQARFQHAVMQILATGRIDVVLLNRAPIELAYHVIATGQLLFQKDLYTRVEFEAQVLGMYGDYLPILRLFQQHALYGDPDGKRVQRYREALRRTQRALGEARTSPRSSSR